MPDLFEIYTFNRLSVLHTLRANKITPTLIRAETQNINLMKKKAIQYSSGKYYRIGEGFRARRYGPYKKPFGIEYPYARRRPAPPAFPYFLNIQEGRLIASWKTLVMPIGDGINSMLYNEAPYSRFMTIAGTRRMIGRPIIQKVISETRLQRFANIHAALLKDLSLEIWEGPSGL